MSESPHPETPYPECRLLCLSRRDVEALLPYSACIEQMRTAMACVSRGEANQPIRQAVWLPDRRGLLGWMPGYVGSPNGAKSTLGIKVVSVFPHNHDSGLPSHQGFVMLASTEDGAPTALLEAGAITAIRTASASAVATDLLARPDSTSLTLFGYGEQAGTHLAALREVRPLERVRVWGRSLEKARAFAQRESEKHGLEIEAVADLETAARERDILCTVTAATEPFLRGAWLEEGVHINAVGSSFPTAREVDDEAVRRARFFVDYAESARALAGEYRGALETGVIEESHLLGEIGQILTGDREGRTSDTEITMFKSLGMSSEDLVAADYVVERAREKGVGQQVTL